MLTKALPFVCWLLLAASAGAATLYENALPFIFLNQRAGALRSNIAFTESDPLNSFSGTEVEFSEADLGGSRVLVTSITTWSVASILGEPLGNEFSSVSLYYRERGGTWQIAEAADGTAVTGTPNQFFSAGDPDLVLNSNPNITHTNVGYRADVPAYEDLTTPGLYYPLWNNTINNLSLELQTGIKYEFAVWGTNPDYDPSSLYGYWFNHFSNPFLSGTPQEVYFPARFLRCDATNLAAPCFEADALRDQLWNKRVNMNIVVEGQVVPEPSTFLMLSVALGGITLRLRKKRS